MGILRSSSALPRGKANAITGRCSCFITDPLFPPKCTVNSQRGKRGSTAASFRLIDRTLLLSCGIDALLRRSFEPVAQQDVIGKRRPKIDGLLLVTWRTVGAWHQDYCVFAYHGCVGWKYPRYHNQPLRSHSVFPNLHLPKCSFGEYGCHTNNSGPLPSFPWSLYS